MGSRVGCHLASTEVCEGVVCFGYPLVSQSGIERIEALTACPVPLLLIQGTRDRLAPLESLRAAIRTRTAPTRLVVVPSGDHSLELTRSHLLRIGKTQADVNLEILSEIRGFLSASDLPLFTEVEVAQATRDR